MGTKIGSLDISNLYVGSTAVNRVYLGTNVVFEISGTYVTGTLPTGVLGLRCYRRAYNGSNWVEISSGSTIHYGDMFFWETYSEEGYRVTNSYNSRTNYYTWNGTHGGTLTGSSIVSIGVFSSVRIYSPRACTLYYAKAAPGTTPSSWTSVSISGNDYAYLYWTSDWYQYYVVDSAGAAYSRYNAANPATLFVVHNNDSMGTYYWNLKVNWYTTKAASWTGTVSSTIATTRTLTPTVTTSSNYNYIYPTSVYIGGKAGSDKTFTSHYCSQVTYNGTATAVSAGTSMFVDPNYFTDQIPFPWAKTSNGSGYSITAITQKVGTSYSPTGAVSFNYFLAPCLNKDITITQNGRFVTITNNSGSSVYAESWNTDEQGRVDYATISSGSSAQIEIGDDDLDKAINIIDSDKGQCYGYRTLAEPSSTNAYTEEYDSFVYFCCNNPNTVPVEAEIVSVNIKTSSSTYTSEEAIYDYMEWLEKEMSAGRTLTEIMDFGDGTTIESAQITFKFTAAGYLDSPTFTIRK